MSIINRCLTAMGLTPRVTSESSAKQRTVGGEKIMAVTTVSDPIRRVDTNVITMFGYTLPSNVTAADIRDDLYGEKIVRWKVIGDSTIHSMEMPVVTDETIRAVITAMRLTC